MRSDTPEASRLAGRARVPKRLWSAAARRLRRRGPDLEALEVRSLLATIPTLVADPQVPLDLAGRDVARDISGSGMPRNDSSPQIAVDPNDPNKLVAVWSTDGFTGDTTTFAEGAYSIDGGKTWSGFDATPVVFIDPASGTSPKALAEVTGSTVSFDRSDNFYLMQIQHATTYGSGVATLAKYSLAGNAPVAQFTGNVLAFWNQGDTNFPQTAIYNAQVAADSNLPTYTDPSGATITDPGSGRVYVAWGANTPPPSGAVNWNPDTVQLLVSTDGGQNFGPASTVGAVNSNGLPEMDGRPRLTISQGTADGRVPGGQVTVVYDDIGSARTDVVPQDIIWAATYQVTPSGVARVRVTRVAATTVLGTAFGASTNQQFDVAPTYGFGPAPVIASDNTLGVASPHQGRIYVAYVDRYNFLRGDPGDATNPADNTDIHLRYSDDGGRTWRTGALGQVNPGLVNDDDGLTDGFSESFVSTPFVTGRAQFMPAIAVDPQTGTVVVSYEDTRWDAIRQRSAVSIAASIDGGNSFAPSTFVDAPEYAQDESRSDPDRPGNALRVALGPIPSNQSAGNPNADGTFGLGDMMGLAAFGGRAYPIWASNLNGGTNTLHQQNIYTGPFDFAGGPRVIAGTMGQVTPQSVVGADGQTYTYNDQTAMDGTPLANGFVVTFDRPIDASSFTADQVHVFYRDPSTGGADAGIAVPVQAPTVGGDAIVPLQAGNTAFGPTRFLVYFAAQAGGQPASGNIGTYTYTVGPGIRDTIPSTLGTRFYYAPQVPNNLPDIPPDASGGTDTGGPGTPSATSTVGIAGVPAGQTIYDVKVHLSLQHTRDADLTIRLIPPSGLGLQPIVLFQNPIANGSDFTDTIFDDTANLNPAVAPVAGPFTGRLRPSQALSVLRGKNPVGTWTLEIHDNQAGNVGRLLSWGLEVTTRTADGKPAQLGNLMDQDADGRGGEDPNGSLIVARQPGDLFAAPAPNPPASEVFNGSDLNPPYAGTTLPLMVSGPHVVRSFVPLAGGGVSTSADNLVTDQTVSSLYIVFDRDMDPTTLGPGAILGMVGPGGSIAGPFAITYTDPATDPNNPDTPGHPRTFRVDFPTQTISGTYTVTLAPTVQSAAGDLLDQNQNAGLDKLRATPSAGVTVQKYTNNTAVNIGGGAAGQQYTATLNVPDSFTIAPPTPDVNGNLLSSVLVQVDIQYPNDADLEADLVAPDGFVVHLFKNVGNTFPFANFNGTIFDDFAGTPIQNGGPPFLGSYNPETGGPTTLTSLAGHFAQGAWKLVITDDQTSGGSTVGKVLDWSLTLLQPQSSTGLGEPVGDRAPASFRIFTQDPTNLQSGQTWTAVGPNGMGARVPGGNAEVAGRISAIAVDPSDPSGNTVYVGAPSGGIWKTANFLTTDPAGPTYVPLTDDATAEMLHVGSIAVLPRNGDPSQTIILAGTGEGDATGDPDRAVNTSRGDNPTARGVGFLLSDDGGRTWRLLDSTDNTKPFAQRDHLFASIAGQYGVTTYKVVIDPGLNRQTGQAVMYAALSDVDGTGHDVELDGSDPNMTAPKGGIWRSLDGGLTWVQMKAGEATDLVLDPNSRSPQSNNLQFMYAGLRGEGVYFSPNQGQVWNVLPGTTGDPLIQNALNNNQPQPVPVGPGASPNAAVLDPSHYGFDPILGQVILAKPALTGNPVSDLNYQGWLYVATAGHVGNYVDNLPSGVALFMTKDFGQNWTPVIFGALQDFLPTNGGLTQSNDYTIAGSGTPAGAPFALGEFNLTLTVDPNDPNVVYLGATDQYQSSGLVRIDTTGIHDPHSFYLDNFNLDPANSLRTAIPGGPALGGGVIVQDPTFGISPVFLDPMASPYLNLIRDPFEPFLNDATILVANTNVNTAPSGFPNNGQQARWVPFDRAVAPDAYASIFDPWSTPTSGQHVALAMPDPLTGKTRLIFGDDQGVYTSVDNGDGTLIGSLGGVADLDTDAGDVPVVQGSRNGNLAVAQFYHGAAQPSTLSAQLAQLSGFFYGSSESGGDPASRPGIVQPGSPDYGNLSWHGPGGGQAIDRYPSRGGVATQQEIKFDKNGLPIGGTVFNYVATEALVNGNFPLGLPRPSTDTFQVNGSGQTFGMYQTSNPGNTPDNQWAYRQGFNFAINPRDEFQRVISSAAGRIFATADNGTQATTWAEIGNPSVLDGTNAQALAFGAPDSSVPANAGGFANFIYAGTKGGNVFVTFTAGGTAGQGNAWKQISNGLDGSPVAQVITNPTGNSHEAYAVTTGGAVRAQPQDAAKPDGSANTGAIPDGGSFSSILTFNAPASFRLADLQVGLDITHPQDSDLVITLTAPDGTVINLVNTGSARGADMTGTVLSDAAATTIAGGIGPYTGAFRPDQALAALYNKPVTGVWTLTVRDISANSQAGTLNGWALRATSLGGVYHMTDSSAANPAWTPIAGNIFDLTADPLGDPELAGTHAIAYLGAIQADWRYVVPDDFSSPGAGTHPILYAAGAGGVVRSLDDGQTWTFFPQGAAGLDNSPLGDGGGLPTANVTDLSLSLGNIDPNNGRPTIAIDPNTGKPNAVNELVATTYGRGSFVIKLAPITFPNQPNQAPILHIDTTTDSGNPDIPGSSTDGVTNNTRPLIDGLSEQTAFGNVVRITLYDATDPSRPPAYIGGYDGTPATDVAANRTRADGTFKVAVTVPFATDGYKLVLVQATDLSGTKGNLVYLTRDGKADRLPDGTPDPAQSLLLIDTTAPVAPANPVLDMQSDSGVSRVDAITNVNINPIFDVTVSAGEPGTTELYLDRDGGQVGMTNGTGTVTDGGPTISDGTHKYTAREIDLAGNAGPSSGPFFVTVDTQTPQPPSSVMLDPNNPAPGGSDSGTPGDNKTNVLMPFFAGTAPANTIPWPNQPGNPLEANQLLILDSAGNLQGQGPIGSNGIFSVQSDLASGSYNLQFQVEDVAGNLSPPSKPLALDIQNRNLTPPTLKLVSTDDSGIVGDNITNVTQPLLIGVGTPGLNIQLIDVAGNVPGSGGPGGLITPKVPPAGSDTPIIVASDGSYQVRFPAPLPDGTYQIVARMFDVYGNTVNSAPLTLQILTQAPTTGPSLTILASDDTGVKGDGMTSVRRPHLTGNTTPNATVFLVDAQSGVTLATTTADSRGRYTVQLPSNLNNGIVPLQARVVDVAGNQGAPSNVLDLRIVTIPGDYDGDGKADPAVLDPTTGTFSVQLSTTGTVTQSTPFAGQAGDVPLQGDFDGDGKTDLAFYRPSNATWYIQRSRGGPEVVQFGQANLDIAVPGDYDGDGMTDIAVYRPSTADWFILGSSTGGKVVNLGQAGVDEPVPGDYDGDGTTDLAVYRPSVAYWLIGYSSGGGKLFQLGQAGLDIPMPFDYDGDGKTDVAVYRPSTATWFELFSGGGGAILPLGQPGVDLPTPGDYDGDGKGDLALYRPPAALFLIQQTTAGPRGAFLGTPNVSVPAAAPYQFRQSPVIGQLSTGDASGFEPLTATATPTTPTPTPDPAPATTPTSLDLGRTAASFAAGSPTTPTVPAATAPTVTLPPPRATPTTGAARRFLLRAERLAAARHHPSPPPVAAPRQRLVAAILERLGLGRRG